jgi:hypothetical protein
MYRTLVTVLLVLSVAAELFGTATVAVNYARGHRVAQGLLGAVGNDDEMSPTPMQELLSQDSAMTANVDVRKARLRLRELRLDMASQLSARWWLTAGLISYGVGAILGLGAALVALNH